MTITIGFIGAGNMASALVGGLLARGHQPQYLALADANTSQLAGFTEQHIFTTTNNADIFQRADVIVLAGCDAHCSACRRQKMRDHLSSQAKHKNSTIFDIKHDAGGIVDLTLWCRQ